MKPDYPCEETFVTTDARRVRLEDPTVEEFKRRSAMAKRIPIAAITEEGQRWQTVTDELRSIVRYQNIVAYITPTFEQRTAEKQKFRAQFEEWYDTRKAGLAYNPSYSYPVAESTDVVSARRTLLGIRDHLQRARIYRSRAEEWYHKSLILLTQDALATCDLVDGLCRRTVDGLTGDALIQRAVRQKYWPLDKALLAYAAADFTDRVLNKPLQRRPKHKLEEKEIGAEEIAQMLRAGLEPYGLLRTEQNPRGFLVKVTDAVSSIDIRHRSREGRVCLVPTTRRCSLAHAIGLVIHECEKHGVQNEEGRRDFCEIWGGECTPDDETLYEALATEAEARWKEATVGADDERHYPYTYIFVGAAADRGESFWAIFLEEWKRYLKTEPGTPTWADDLPSRSEIPQKLWEDAFDDCYLATYRVAGRGHLDCAKPYGAFPKDFAYARGEEIQRTLREEGLDHYTQAGHFNRQGFVELLSQVEITPDDLPLKDLHIGERMTQEALATLGNPA